MSPNAGGSTTRPGKLPPGTFNYQVRRDDAQEEEQELVPESTLRLPDRPAIQLNRSRPASSRAFEATLTELGEVINSPPVAPTKSRATQGEITTDAQLHELIAKCAQHASQGSSSAPELTPAQPEDPNWVQRTEQAIDDWQASTNNDSIVATDAIISRMDAMMGKLIEMQTSHNDPEARPSVAQQRNTKSEAQCSQPCEASKPQSRRFSKNQTGSSAPSSDDSNSDGSDVEEGSFYMDPDVPLDGNQCPELASQLARSNRHIAELQRQLKELQVRTLSPGRYAISRRNLPPGSNTRGILPPPSETSSMRRVQEAIQEAVLMDASQEWQEPAQTPGAIRLGPQSRWARRASYFVRTFFARHLVSRVPTHPIKSRYFRTRLRIHLQVVEAPWYCDEPLFFRWNETHQHPAVLAELQITV